VTVLWSFFEEKHHPAAFGFSLMNPVLAPTKEGEKVSLTF
jgi:hypothetical protein